MIRLTPGWPRARKERSQGQSIVEFAILLPVYVMLLFGMLEFGFAFTHHMTLEYASREGARVGAALGAGTPSAPCSGTSPEPVDWQIVAAVQRVLTSPGSQIPVGSVTQLKIYKATASGAQQGGLVNTWVPGSGPSVDGVALRFTPQSTGWSACGRKNTLTGSVRPDSIGVALTYDYSYITPLGALMGIAGPAHLTITDKTIMALNPTSE